jgi:hypothetical protein
MSLLPLLCLHVAALALLHEGPAQPAVCDVIDTATAAAAPFSNLGLGEMLDR